jgi:two-component system response regulator PilR (NtrC family)
MSSSPPKKRVLIVEDEPSFREVLEMGLAPQGFLTKAVGSLSEARVALEADHFDAMVSDLRLGDGTAIELLTWMKGKNITVPAVILTAFATTETTVQALNLGAVDFLTKTKNDIAELTKVLQGIFQESEPGPSHEISDIGDLVGIGDTIRKIQALVGKIARADTTVLITGDSGTGKEIVARLIHRYSERGSGPFIPVNCGALPEALLESELFGYEKGAFTGATGVKRGLFEEANGGFLFLDEIGEMPLPLQVKLLRVLQERKLRRLGATEERSVDVRVIGATNRNLRERTEESKFREDLYYRLNILNIELPPLRDRREDLPVLIEHFLRRSCKKLNKPSMYLQPDALRLLERYRFPGNVRELENLMERCVALNPGGAISKDYFPDNLLNDVERGTDCSTAPSLSIPAGGFDLEGYLAVLKGYFLHQGLMEQNGNRTKAAKHLGMTFRAYRYWLGHLGGIEALPRNFPWPKDFPPHVEIEAEEEGTES